MTVARRAAAVVVGIGVLMLLPLGPTAAPPAQAHPLGNFTVNQYHGLTVHPDRIEVLAVLDTAEIPTIQQRPAVDTDSDGAYSAAEAAAHATTECAGMGGALSALADGAVVTFAGTGAEAVFPPGEQSLPTTRVTCRFTAPADLSAGGEIEFTSTFRDDRIGWREITAAGAGVALTAADVPAQSPSQQLRSYPEDLLTDPLDQRSARITTAPGNAAAPAPLVRLPDTGVGLLDAALNAGGRLLNGLATTPELTPAVATLAVLMALVLGAAHAALPGHGKTVMAAYLAGKQGTRRDAVAVGATVTITHTAGVLVFGLLITLVATFAPVAAMRWLGVVSGVLVAAVGVALLRTALRRRRELAVLAPAERTGVLVVAAVGGSGIGAGRGHGHGHGGHAHGHGHGHGGHGHGGHGHAGADGVWSRLSLVGMGVAGGLVPSPTALLVLLAAVQFGRTWLGIGLVLCYALGMAATLTAAGLLLVSVRDRLARTDRLRAWRAGGRRLAGALPVATAVLVLVVGLGLALSALAG